MLEFSNLDTVSEGENILNVLASQSNEYSVYLSGLKSEQSVSVML